MRCLKTGGLQAKALLLGTSSCASLETSSPKDLRQYGPKYYKIKKTTKKKIGPSKSVSSDSPPQRFDG